MTEALQTTVSDLTAALATVGVNNSVRARRLEALEEARRCQALVRSIRHAIACHPYGASGSSSYYTQFDELTPLGDELDEALNEWRDAIWAMNWSYFYRTRAEAEAARHD